ncbi:MAG TPA: DUF4142 domain-containing protein [Drouetiella sp.]
MKKLIVALALVGSAITPVVAAESTKPADAEFAKKVAVDGMTEVKLGEMAEKKGTSEKVKEFAHHMVKDHGQANEELKSVATRCGVKLPGTLDGEHQAVYDKLNKLSGTNFDKQYLEEMVSAHKKAVAALEGECKTGEGPIKDWASKTLPTIKEHLSEAEADCKSTKS